jgi:hypothetical protein
MNYTITELTDGNAVVTFADGAWANVPVLTEDTQEVFEERVQGFATKIVGANPAWIAVDQTGSVTQENLADVLAVIESDAEVDASNPAWLNARITAYGAVASQLEYITENGLAAWQTEVARIKALHPQPE